MAGVFAAGSQAPHINKVGDGVRDGAGAFRRLHNGAAVAIVEFAWRIVVGGGLSLGGAELPVVRVSAHVAATAAKISILY